MLEKIKKIIIEEIRPRLLEHRGDINLVGFKEGIVEVKLLGGCSGCPSAKITLKQLIESKLKEKIPQIKEVVLINEISQDLIDMALSILNQSK